MRNLMFVLSLFLAVPTIEALPLRPIPGLAQGGPVAKVRAIRERIKERRAARQARKDAAAAAKQAQQVQAQ